MGTTSAREAARTRLGAFVEKQVGREEALAKLVRSVCGPRLVTLSGAAGVGKSALATAAAERLAEAGAFPGGVYWVGLSGVVHEAQAYAAVAQRVPLEHEPCLAILDAVDQLAAPHLVARLLERFPLLHLLVTARQPLGAAQEVVQEVLPLSSSDARRLLVGSVGQPLDPHEAAALARLLDGNPQAIRLAAPLLEVADPAALRYELERRLMNETSVSSLHAVRDVLLASLPEPARHLLGVLYLFATGAAAEDMEALVGASWPTTMELLLRAGLVVEEEARYRVIVDLPASRASLGPLGVLLALALGQLRSHQHQAAFTLAERALTAARASQNREGFARALLVLGMVTLADEPARAALLLEEAATHFETLRDPARQAQARLWQGKALSEFGEAEAALAALYEAQEHQPHPALTALFAALQEQLTARGGGSLLAALEGQTTHAREAGLLAVRLSLGLPGK